MMCRLVGVWLGYVSSFFYLSSRMSQLYKNWARKCTEGLSVAMFLMAISANVRVLFIQFPIELPCSGCPAGIRLPSWLTNLSSSDSIRWNS